MRIGELADLAGVTVRTVRYYHHKGVLTEPDRLSNGYRMYTVDHLVLLVRIRQLTESGLSLDHARAVIDDSGASREDVLDEVQDALDQRIATLTAQRDRLARARATGRVGLSPLAAALTVTPSDMPVSILFAHLYGDGEQADRLAETLRRPDVAARIAAMQQRFESIDDTSTVAELDDLAEQLADILAEYLTDVPAATNDQADLLLALAERDLNDRQRAFLRSL